MTCYSICGPLHPGCVGVYVKVREAFSDGKHGDSIFNH